VREDGAQPSARADAPRQPQPRGVFEQQTLTITLESLEAPPDLD